MHGQDSEKNRKELVNYYDDYVSRQKQVGVNLRHHSIIEKLKYAGLKSHHQVLEIGCGIGTFTSLLVEEVKEGSIVSMDISGKSIEEAKLVFGKYAQLELIHADVVEYNFKDITFDVVVLPDVLEHIPIEFHNKLFEKISKVLSPSGFVFIHIPNPYFLEWCHQYNPEMLQIIDQPITTDLLVRNTYPHGLYIHELKTYSIWVVEGDYQYIVLKPAISRDFGNIIEERISFWDKVKFKLNAIFK